MALLVVLPVEFITENAEVSVTLRQQADQFRQQIASALNVSRPTKIVDKGAYRGTQLYNWSGNFNAIVHASFLLPPGIEQSKEFIRVVSFIRQPDCVHLGSVWSVTGPGAEPMKPTSLPLASLSQIASRTIRSVNTVRFDTKYPGFLGARGRVMFDAVFSEESAKQGLPVNSSISRFACKWVSKEIGDSTQQSAYPARAHRVLVTEFVEVGKTNGHAQVTLRSDVHSGIFGDQSTRVLEERTAVAFDPPSLVAKLLPPLQASLHDLEKSGMKIVSRKGRWVTLDKGRAFGLKIGMHLLGPNAAKLHVIQFAPQQKELPDAAIAQVRIESAAQPLKTGDEIRVDPALYPKSGK